MQDGTAQLRIRRLSNFAANGLPVGFECFTINKNIRTGSLPLLGGLYSRELYADLWSWIQEQPGYLITETEWQAKSQANNGNVPFYSSGDGSTTFRVPSLKCWVKSGSEITEVGSYLAAGLPNIIGEIKNNNDGYAVNAAGSTFAEFENNGCYTFEYATGTSISADITTANVMTSINFNASNSNSIYGNSDEVTPESIVGLYCVIAFSTISNVGNLDVQILYNKIIELEGKLENADSTPTGTILPFAGNTIPSGFLACNGAAVSRTTYSALFSAIGTTYGSGDGSSTFNVPQLEDNRFVEFHSTRFVEFHSTRGTKKNAGLPNITGKLNLSKNNTRLVGDVNPSATGAIAVSKTSGSFWRSDAYNNSGTYWSGFTFNAQSSNTIYGDSTTVQPKSLTVRAIIKY